MKNRLWMTLNTRSNMKAANPYDANGYHTEIVSGSFDDLQQPSPVRAEPIRTIAYDQEYQYEEDDTDRKYRTPPPKNSPKKFFKKSPKDFVTRLCLIGFAIGLIIGIIILIAIVVPVAVTHCALGTVASTPNWIGKFQMDSSCDRSSCCCFTNQIILSQVSNNQLQLSGNVNGVCNNVPSTVTLTQSMPSGFQSNLIWAGQTIRVQLGLDNSYIALVNVGTGSCSATGLRTSYNSVSTMSMNAYLIMFILTITIGNCMT
ncbi:unnamed protein product [Adineta ricciae]|uniref:Uncharacterized protein n=2 Tax=Adineta ricciae TaxID=249248 RepID=A0A814TF09_ADIRI|nr:unnamed protein product [Adineta ricciae]